MSFSSNTYSSRPGVLVLLLLLAPLVACNSSSSSGGSGGSGGGSELPPLELTVVSDIMQLHLAWNEDEAVDVIYSADPACDWDNYSVCDQAGIISGLEGGHYQLLATEHDLDRDTGWYFVVDDGERRSPVAGGRPAAVGFDNRVDALAVVGDQLYVGGRFDRAGAVAPAAAILNRDGNRVSALPPVNGSVRSIIPDGEGGWYIGGLFNRIGDQAINNAARIRPDGSLDPDFRPEPSSDVRALILDGDMLYMGGAFTQVNEQGSFGVALVDADTGEFHYTGIGVGRPGVNALALVGDTLYVGGNFTDVPAGDRTRLAAFDTESHELLDWDPAPDSEVHTLAPANGRLYVGGRFNEIAGEDIPSLAAFELDSGEIDTDWAPASSFSQVRSLSVHDNILYVGGEYSSMADHIRTSLSAFDLNTGEITGWSPSMHGWVYSLVADETAVYVGGFFNFDSGGARNHLAAFDRETGLLTDWNPLPNQGVEAIAEQRGRLFVGGQFNVIDARERRHLAGLHAENGTLTDWNPGADYWVTAFALGEDRLIVGGQFNEVAGEPRDRLAAFDTSSQALTDWQPDISFSTVNDILVNGETTYLTGWVNDAGSETREGLAAVDTSNGELLAWAPTINLPGNALARHEDRLIVGGRFGQANGESHENLVAFHSETGALHDDVLPEPSNTVHSLVSDNTTLYVGGEFNDINDETHRRLAAMDVETGEIQDWTLSLSGRVEKIALSGDHLYAVGSLHSINSEPADGAIAVDKHTGEPKDWPARLDNGSPNTLTARNGRIYIGGTFYEANDQDRIGLAVFDAETGELLW